MMGSRCCNESLRESNAEPKRRLITEFTVSFFSPSRRRHTRSLRDWSSDVCSSDLIGLGIGGLEAEPGDHICGVFSGEQERDQILIPLLQAGLASGDKCICVVDGTSPEEIVATLGPGGQAATLTAGKQLEVIGAADMYLRSGRFSADEVIGAWKAAISDTMYAGQFDVVRAVETWSRREVLPDMQELLMLESEMNRYLDRK